jgi:hypothetical protein
VAILSLDFGDDWGGVGQSVDCIVSDEIGSAGKEVEEFPMGFNWYVLRTSQWGRDR